MKSVITNTSTAHQILADAAIEAIRKLNAAKKDADAAIASAREQGYEIPLELDGQKVSISKQLELIATEATRNHHTELAGRSLELVTSVANGANVRREPRTKLGGFLQTLAQKVG